MNRYDYEAAIVGIMLRDPKAYWKVSAIISGADFEDAKLRALYEALASLIKRDVAADWITLGELVPSLTSFAMDLESNTGSTRNVKLFADRLARESQSAKVRDAGRTIAELDSKSAAGIFAEAQRVLSSCMRAGVGTVHRIGDLAANAYGALVERWNLPGDAMSGLPYGLLDIDEMTDGMQPSDLIVIAARPSVGKTALGLQLCQDTSEHGKASLFVSIEMAAGQLALRLLSNKGNVDSLRMRRPKRMADEEWDRVAQARDAFADAKLFVIDDARSLEAISAKSHELKATEDIALIVVDYLQMMDMPEADKTADAIQIVSRGMKQLAKDLRISVVVLSQLNREGDEEPKLRHLRDGGSIEQDADVVILMHRPDKKRPSIVCANIAKQRNGPVGKVYLETDMATGRFSSQPADYEGPQPAQRGASRGLGADDAYARRRGE